MTVRFLLDTNVVSEPVARRPNREVVRQLERNSTQCAIGSPVWHELNYGARRLPAGKRRYALIAYLEDVVAASFPILSYDEDAAAWHARERVRLEKRGIPAPYVDGQIAAIAHINGLVLVTANAPDFSPYDGLEVQNWFKPSRRA